MESFFNPSSVAVAGASGSSMKLGYDTLSGGEKDLVSLCLRLAFPKVQAASFLLLDEVFGSQDAERQINIIQALLRIREHFPQILLTTHTQEAKEYAEAVLQFNWDGGETKVAWAA